MSRLHFRHFIALAASVLLTSGFLVGSTLAKPLVGDSVGAAVMNDAQGHMATPAISITTCPHDRTLGPDSMATAEVWFRFQVADSAAAESIQVVYISDTASIYRYLAMYALSRLYFPTDSVTAGQWVYHRVICRCNPQEVDPQLDMAPIDDQRLITTDVVPQQPARPIHKQEPIYPQEAKAAGTVGTVEVRALVNDSGQVRIATVMSTSGEELLDRSALEAALLTTYKPTVRMNHPVWSWISYKVEFKL